MHARISRSILLFCLLAAQVQTHGAAHLKSACRFTKAVPIPVIFFGGNGSTENQTQAWSEVARNAPKYMRHFQFEGHSLHGADSDFESVRSAARVEINDCIESIHNPQFKGPVYLVGHSDGGWVVNEIVKKMPAKDRHKVKLVLLDGPNPEGSEFENVHLQCWTSYMVERQGPRRPRDCASIASNARSRATGQMLKCRAGTCHPLAQKGCHSDWCLHFRLINRNAPADLENANYAQRGYERVDPPLSFLDADLPAHPKNHGHSTTAVSAEVTQ